MNLLEFLSDPEWDAPFFKQLAHNDTGQAAGHQGGMVVPKDLWPFFPALDGGAANAFRPTVDRHLRVEMYVGTRHLAGGTVRYQLQTWGGTRTPEGRLTDGFAPLRNAATAGDLIIFQRNLTLLDHFRLVLVRRRTPDFASVSRRIAARRWGPVNAGVSPMVQRDLEAAVADIEANAGQPFVIQPRAKRVVTRQTRIARDTVFRKSVCDQYGCACAVSSIAISGPDKLCEVEAAHVVPLSEGGPDDVRNGLALARTIHWAFDRGFIGLLPDRTVFIPRQVKAMPGNVFLRRFEGKAIGEARTARLRLDRAALDWHYDNRVRRWE